MIFDSLTAMNDQGVNHKHFTHPFSPFDLKSWEAPLFIRWPKHTVTYIKTTTCYFAVSWMSDWLSCWDQQPVLHQKHPVCPLFSFLAAENLIQAFITSGFDWCNSTLYGTSSKVLQYQKPWATVPPLSPSLTPALLHYSLPPKRLLALYAGKDAD